MTPKLEAGPIDLYVGTRGDTERGLQTASLFREPLSVVAPKEHPVASRKLTKQAYVSFAHVHVSPRREHGLVALRAPVKLPPFDICVARRPRFDKDPGLVWLRSLLGRAGPLLLALPRSRAWVVGRAAPEGPSLLGNCGVAKGAGREPT